MSLYIRGGAIGAPFVIFDSHNKKFYIDLDFNAAVNILKIGVGLHTVRFTL